MKEKFITIYTTCRLWVSSSASLSPMNDSLPFSLITPPARIIENLYSKALSLTTSGKFIEAQSIFVDALQYCSFFLGSSDTDYEVLKKKCREYILGLNIELKRRSISTSSDLIGKSIGLSFLFTQCDLDSIHLLLTLRSALSLAIKSGNYKMGVSFARRLLHENQSANSTVQLPLTVISQIQKTLVVCEEHIRKAESQGLPSDAQPSVPSTNSFVSGSTLKYICARSFEAVWNTSGKEEPLICTFCNSCYHRSLPIPFVCDICHLCEITN